MPAGCGGAARVVRTCRAQGARREGSRVGQRDVLRCIEDHFPDLLSRIPIRRACGGASRRPQRPTPGRPCRARAAGRARTRCSARSRAFSAATSRPAEPRLPAPRLRPRAFCRVGSRRPGLLYLLLVTNPTPHKVQTGHRQSRRTHRLNLWRRGLQSTAQSIHRVCAHT